MGHCRFRPWWAPPSQLSRLSFPLSPLGRQEGLGLFPALEYMGCNVALRESFAQLGAQKGTGRIEGPHFRHAGAVADYARAGLRPVLRRWRMPPTGTARTTANLDECRGTLARHRPATRESRLMGWTGGVPVSREERGNRSPGPPMPAQSKAAKSNASIAVIGIDIGKNVFHLIGLDRRAP